MKEKDTKFPGLDRQLIHCVDATPNSEYPIRILRAYRDNCLCKWYTSTDKLDTPKKSIFEMMNERQDKRLEILDKAIKILEREMKNL